MIAHKETMNRHTIPGSAGVSPACRETKKELAGETPALPGRTWKVLRNGNICKTHHHCRWRTRGLTLGIGLRQRGVPAALWEAGHYPRHRVCGEFICGRGQETLARLGLHELLERAGAVGADTAAFFSATQFTRPLPLPSRAICLSRFSLDAALAEKFRELGGELWEGKRRSDGVAGEGVVRATGRRLQTEEGGARWFGLKAHARNVPLAAGLEMHVSPRGYVVYAGSTAAW